jgi:uncharacterized Fe-S cluster-containing radical SAM superfamily protein
LLRDRDVVTPLSTVEGNGSAPKDALELYEPRIGYIRGLLESLLGVIDLEVDGETVHPDAFLLKNLRHWLGPGGGANEIVAHAASRCNLKCRFCYNRGAPATLKPRTKPSEEEYAELRTRIEHYVPRAKLNLFPDLGSPCEALVHPHILEVLRALRGKTREPLRIPSNGSTLTPELIEALAELEPISLDVSLNSATPERRQWLMGDPEPRVALDSLGHLRAAQIPYSVVIVPWPLPSREEMLSDLRRTVAFAAGHEPTAIQVSLPGYSRAFSKEEVFPHEEVWGELKAAVQELRDATECPIVLRPGLFEEYTDPVAVNEPRLVGVVQSSPVERAGLRPGDRILQINGLPVKSRFQARSLLTLLHDSDLNATPVRVQRNGAEMNFDVDLSGFGYPYTPETATHLGAVFASSGIPRDWVEKLHGVLVSRRAENVLLLSSLLVRPTVERLLGEQGMPPGVELHIRVPRNRYLGGNILMGDLLVVQDFIGAVEEFVAEAGTRPDLVVIPSSPFHVSRWGRDLVGRVYTEIERHTGVPVALAECEPIFD